MCHHVDLAKARWRAIPVVERADRNLAPDCRVEACASPLTAARPDLYIAEHAVDGCSADGENKITIRPVELQSAMVVKWRQQGRNQHLEPFAAHAIRFFPQRRQCIFDSRDVPAPARSRRLLTEYCNSLALPECAHRMLAMPARRRAQLVEDAPLSRPPGRPVALRHHRHHLAPRAHADSSRHRRHRPDSVTLPQTLARTCSVTFLVRQCAGQICTPNNKEAEVARPAWPGRKKLREDQTRKHWFSAQAFLYCLSAFTISDAVCATQSIRNFFQDTQSSGRCLSRNMGRTSSKDNAGSPSSSFVRGPRPKKAKSSPNSPEEPIRLSSPRSFVSFCSNTLARAAPPLDRINPLINSEPAASTSPPKS